MPAEPAFQWYSSLSGNTNGNALSCATRPLEEIMSGAGGGSSAAGAFKDALVPVSWQVAWAVDRVC